MIKKLFHVIVEDIVVFVFAGQLSFSSIFPGGGTHNRRPLTLGSFFRRYRGFDRISQEESDEMEHLNSDSEVEEYSATSSHKA